MLIDTHVHLNSDKFQHDLDAVITRARNAGVETMIVVGFDKPTNQKAMELAEQVPFLYATVGYHPTEAPNVTEEDFVLLEEQLAHKKVVGVGECGLDFYWDKEHIDLQIKVFERQIALSKALDKPLVVHMRDASEATYNVLAEHSPLRGIMHCYSGSAEMAPLFLDLGMHISLGGPVTFHNGHKPKAVARIVPLDRLLIETDAPYLSPHPHRGKRNEPARVRLVAEAIAAERNLPLATIADHTTKNAKDLFRI